MSKQTQTQVVDEVPDFLKREARMPFDDEKEGSNLPVPLSRAVPHAPQQATDGLQEMIRLAAEGPARNFAALAKEAERIGRALGQDGYYDFPAGGGRISGPSVWLMEALESAWGSTFTQVVMERVEGQRVILRARFVDLKTLVVKERPAFYTLSNPPGKFDADRWAAMQLGAAASKAARTVLEHGLPAWYSDIAYQAAREAARSKILGGKPLQEVAQETIKWFGSQGVTQEELVALVGLDVALWVDLTIQYLRDLARALAKGETTIPAAFAGVRAKAQDAAAQDARSKLGVKPAGQS